MMNDDDLFLEALRQDAAPLRHEPDDEVLWSRLQARVHGRVHALRTPPTVAQLLSGWLRPVAASLVALAIAGSVVVGMESHSGERSTATLDALSQPPSDMSAMYEELVSAGY
jgi:hypothetical protein